MSLKSIYPLYEYNSSIYEQVKFIDELKHSDSDQVDAIALYTGPNGYDINSALRLNTSSSLAKYKMVIDLIDLAFNEVPKLVKPIIVYRTIDDELTYDYSDKGYISTTTDKYTEQDEYTCCTLVITVPIGTPILPIKALSVNPNENEILLERNGILVYNGHKTIDNNFIVNMTYLSPKSELVKKTDLKQVGDLVKMDFVHYLESNIGDIYNEFISLYGTESSKEGFIEYYKTYITEFDKRKNTPFVVNAIIKQLDSKINELFD